MLLANFGLQGDISTPCIISKLLNPRSSIFQCPVTCFVHPVLAKARSNQIPRRWLAPMMISQSEAAPMTSQPEASMKSCPNN